MNYLAVDTSGKNLTLVIQKDNIIKEFYDGDCGVNHSVNLMPEIEKLLSSVDYDLATSDFFVSVVGPGSFTGIRIGVSAVKAFALAFNKPVLSITSFDTIAYNVKSGKRLAIIDAKHNCYYVCGYDGDKVVIQPTFVSKEEVLKYQGEYQFYAFENLLGLGEVKVVCVVEGLKEAIKAKANNLIDAESLTPLYIRKSQAEEGR